MNRDSPLRCPLAGTGFIEVGGSGATDFLEAQLSARIRGLPPGIAPLAGWHDAKGRVRALLRLVPLGDRWLALTPREGIAQVIAGLRLYVLRAPVRIDDASDGWRALALPGDSDRWLASRAIELDRAPGALATDDGLRWLRIGPQLVCALGPAQAIGALEHELAHGDVAPEAVATLAEIRLGIPSVPQVLAGRYVAQMLNLDRLGAVAFDKGCFPGQEIIARARNLGQVKRRMQRFEAAASPLPPPGTAVIDADGADAGEVVRSAHGDHGTTELLAVVRLDALDAPLFVAEPTRTRLEHRPLPYE